MTDLFDQQITDGLHRAAAGAHATKGSFRDVRRRVRARRARQVAAVSLPAVAGLALVGLRQTPQPNPLSPAAAPDPTIDSGAPAPDITVTPSAVPTVTTSIDSTTIPSELIDGVVCLDATPDASPGRCLTYLPGARTMTAPSFYVIQDTPTFVVPADSAYQAEAQALSDRLGLPLRPDITAHLQQDLAGTDLTGVRVFVVMGTSGVTTCTVPGCDTTVTSAPFNEAFADQVARSAAVFQALGFREKEVIAHGDDKVQLRALDPDNPDARSATLTIGRAAPEDQTTSTTIGFATRPGTTSVMVQHGPWTYQLDVIDAFGGPLPTGDELIALLHTTFGGSLG